MFRFLLRLLPVLTLLLILPARVRAQESSPTAESKAVAEVREATMAGGNRSRVN